MPRFTTVFLLIIIASLSSMAQDPKLILPIGHSKGITDVAESANGKWVITSSWDGSVKLWDRYTNKLLHTFQYKDGITGISLSRDNRYLAAGSFDSTVTVWEIGTRKLVRQFGPYTDRMGDVKFLDNTRLSITYADCLPSHVCPSRFMEVWDIAANKLLEAGKGNYYTDDGSLVQFTEKNLVILNKEKKDSVVINIPELKGLYIFRKKWGGYLVWDNNHFYFCDKSGMNKGRVEMNYNIKSVFFSANEEKILLQSGYTPFAELRNFSDTTLIRNFGVNEYDDRSILLAYHPGDDIVYVTAAELDSCYVRDVSGKKRSFDAFPVTANNSTEFRFTKDNKFMYATGANDLLFWELNKNSPSAWFRGYTHPKLRAELALKDSLLLVMSDSTNIEAWEPVQNKLLYTLAETAGPIRTMEISTDQTKFLTLDHQNTIQLWDTRSGKQLQKIRIGSNSSSIGDGGVRWVKSSKPQGDPRIENRFEVPEYVFSTIKLSPNGRYIAGASAEQDGLGIWDLRSGKLVLNLKIGADGVYDCDFSADENKLVAVGRDDRAILLDIPTKTITNLNHDGITISDFVRFAGNQLVLQRDKVFVCFDAATGKEINKTNCTGTLRGFSPDGKMMIVQKDDECQVWDFPISRMISKTKLPEIDRLSFLKDPTKALVSYTYGEAPVLLNLLTGIVERSYPEEMAGKAVYHNQHQLIYTLRDNKVQRWNPLTGKLIASFFSVGKDQFLTQVPAGYYQTSPEAAKLLHYVTKDFKVISFEQLDVKYNRPDKVLTAIGNTDTALIKSYKKAWEKRIRKLRIDTTAFRDGYSVPEADFADRDKIAFEQSNGLLSLHIKGADSIYKIDRFNIWVNESPLFGQRGISLRKKNSNRIDTTIQVQLSQGENRIETSITNVNGTESYRMPLQVNYTPVVKQKEMTRFVGIGIDRFADKIITCNTAARISGTLL
ncbi:MAG: hypothetical protein IPG86_09560 [Chitinophagaceae bacterium]|nr:hypothetical protein [Chitinophagaceae bacterium]